MLDPVGSRPGGDSWRANPQANDLFIDADAGNNWSCPVTRRIRACLSDLGASSLIGSCFLR
jgi:hypothetical protein